MDNKLAQSLITKTRDDYNRISDHFSSTRQFIWPDITAVLDTLLLQKEFKVLDLGCGNGRFAKYFIDQGIDYYGYDISEQLIEIAQRNNPQGHFTFGNLLNTAFQDNKFDLVISIATLHHIPSREMREQALREIRRVLKSDGIAIISIWYFWNQPKYLKLMIKEALKKVLGKSELDFADFMISWKNEKQEIKAERYLHAWRKRELKASLINNNFTKVDQIKNNKSHNLVIVAKSY